MLSLIDNVDDNILYYRSRGDSMTIKNEVLSVLEQNRNAVISGQMLAEKLNVSRSAIWKAIKSLQADGYKIYATTNKGYQLDINSDLMSAAGIRAFLSEQNKNCQIFVYKTLDSTNSEAKRLALGGAQHGTIIVAEEQTAGRGRVGKTFFSPPKTGIYMSFILRPQVDINDSQLVTVYAAVSVCKVVERLTGLCPQIKWVNDIYLNGKKICGILTEAISDFESGSIESIIVGVGINFSTKQDDFPLELRNIAGSLFATGISRNKFAAALIDEIMAHGDFLFQSNLVELYKERSLMLGREIICQKNGLTVCGTVLDINEKGNLVVKTKPGQIDVLHSGEVKIVSKNYNS